MVLEEPTCAFCGGYCGQCGGVGDDEAEKARQAAEKNRPTPKPELTVAETHNRQLLRQYVGGLIAAMVLGAILGWVL